MESAKELTIQILKDLIATCKTGFIFFKAASEKISEPNLKATFNHYAIAKKENMCKLEAEVERLGGEITKVGKDLQINANILEEFDYLDNEGKILSECEKVDNAVLNKYSNAINDNILWEVIPLVAKQYFDSVNLHDRFIFMNQTQQHTAYS